MIRSKKIHKKYADLEADIDAIIQNFETAGKAFGNQDRNTLKEFRLGYQEVIVKSFRVPNIINQIAYKFFRKSKAERSYTYANKLKELGVGTPDPIAFYEFETLFLFKNSYYLSVHVEADLTYRALTTNLNYPNHEAILRAFTRFTFDLHEKEIHFLDHSPGNTLIKINKDSYDFYLVDLNRMSFGNLDLETRIKNFARLTIHKSMVEIMSDEYAKCIGEPFEKVFQLMWQQTEAFQAKYHRKQRLKKRLKFWKKYD
ncbi:Kdo domain containing protein [Gaetbulibacter aestuarii]|uniref:Kdo domain containing protein n=1 Tax=Gaetbulibacter aestuarii TaxID=1502358 RepID=A0ABW7MXT6_9FLAO